jgi:hypothetical protein
MSAYESQKNNKKYMGHINLIKTTNKFPVEQFYYMIFII